jgi:hypothetical protein
MIRSTMKLAGSRRRDGTRAWPGPECYRVGQRARIRGQSRPRFLPITLLALAVSAGLAGPGHAQQAASSAQGDAAAAARTHFDAALVHYRAHRYREAIREFELSVSIVPNADVWFDLGRAHEQLGELSEAIDSYQRYLRDRVDATDAAALRDHIDELRQRSEREHAARVRREQPAQGSLAIDAQQAGARVALDGQELGTAPLDRVVQVEPGGHRVSARAEGYAPFDAHIDVQPGAVSAAYVRLLRLRTADQQASPRVATWTFEGASAVALASGTALALISGAERDAGRFDRSDDLGVASRVSFGAALGLAAGAMLAYVLEAKSAAPSERAPRAIATEHEAAWQTASLTLAKSR